MSHYKSSTPPTKGSNDIDLSRSIGVLIDHKWLIIGITALFAAAGVVYALLSAPIYRADALVQVEQLSPSNPLSDGTGMLSREPPSRSEIEIIGSRMVLGRAVDILSLDLLIEPVRLPIIGDFLSRAGVKRPGFANGWPYTWAGETLSVEAMPVDDAYRGKTFILKVVDAQRYSLHFEGENLGEASVDKEAEFLGGAVSLTVDAINAPPKAEFSLSRIQPLLAIADIKNNLSISEQGKETGILRLGLTSEEPAQAKDKLRTIVDIYVAQNIQHQSEEARKSLEFLSKQLPVVRTELTKAENQLNAYRIDRESIDLSIETRSVLERLVNIEGKLNELEFSEAEISRRFTPTHPTYAALLDKKSQLQKERASIESKIDRLPETQQEILRLQRDASVNQEIYVQLRNKVQEMQIAEASTVGNVRVLDNAEVFPNPVAPKKSFILVVATLLGGLVAVGVVLVRPMFKRGVQTLEQIEALGLPVLATVPLSEEQEKLSRRGRPVAEAALLAQRNPADTSVEALRALRTSLHFSMMSSDNNCVMITGPSPAVGKSFVSANLAAVCAQMGQRVLIIDGDMRKGHIHSIFGESSEGGLSETLSDQQTLEEVVRPVSGIENLHYISRGVAPPNPSELLSKPEFSELLKTCQQRFDLVIVDSPPVLAVTDAAVIGRQVGITLMVARYQLNPPKEIEVAVHRLGTAGVRVTGAILNALERKAAAASGYGDYAYSYK